MSLDKKIKDTFNPPPSLKGEDWLVPSDDLFDSIESAIYDEPRRKRRPIWIWLLPLLFMSALAIYFMISNNETEAGYTNNSIKEIQSTTNAISRKIIEQKELNNNNLTLEENSINDQKSSSKRKSINQNGSDNSKKMSTDVAIDEPKGQSFNNPISQIVRADIEDENLSNVGFISAIELKNSVVEVEINRANSRSNYDVAKLTGINNFITHATDLPLSNLSSIIIDINKNDISSWNLKFSTGISHWNFDLNNNYLTALEPADFSFSNGTGYFVELGLEKRLSRRVSVGVTALAENNSFDSGHNSVIDYDINNENSAHTLGFDLTMASPLGFLESNIIVARNVDANEHTDLIIDLDNIHTITNIDLGLYAQINILQYRKFSLGGQFGGGLNYLSHITNNLDQFSTSEAGFDSHSSEILKDQSNLSLLRPYLNIGVNLEYKWSQNISLGINYQYRKDLNAIYNSGDFSTLVSRQLSGFYIKKAF